VQQKKSARRQSGGAALEAMLLIPLILTILIMLVNMGYNGVRHRKTQSALRLGAFEYVDGLARTDKVKSKQQAQASVSQKMFPGESEPLTLSVSGKSNAPGVTLPEDNGILANMSFRQVVGISAKRDPPYDIFPPTPLTGTLIVASNTFTFCEMKDEDFDSVGQDALDGLVLVGNVALWLFGGCGGSAFDFSCDDRCQK
jgi:hypothetical protein